MFLCSESEDLDYFDYGVFIMLEAKFCRNYSAKKRTEGNKLAATFASWLITISTINMSNKKYGIVNNVAIKQTTSMD